jgi:hypothetical protein
MNPVTPFGVAYPFVGPYGTEDNSPHEAAGRRIGWPAGPLPLIPAPSGATGITCISDP